MDLVVGRIGKAHGVNGEVSVDVRTDDPDVRFVEGSVLRTDPDRGPLTVVRARAHHGRLLVAFDGCADRATAETLRGALLVVDSETAGETDADEWWDHELVGLLAVTPAGDALGHITAVIHVPGPPLLAVERDGLPELLVPFVAAFVPDVDIPAGRVVIDPPDGLLDLNPAQG